MTNLLTFILHVDSALSGGLSIPQSNTGCVSPTVRLTWPEGVLQWWTWHQTMKTDIPMCPTSRCSFPRVHMFGQPFCVGNVLTSWGRPHAECFKSPSDTISDRCTSFGNYSIAVRAFRVHQQFLNLKKLFNWLHKECKMLWMFSANRLHVLCFINKDSLSVVLINMMTLRD